MKRMNVSIIGEDQIEIFRNLKDKEKEKEKMWSDKPKYSFNPLIFIHMENLMKQQNDLETKLQN